MRRLLLLVLQIFALQALALDPRRPLNQFGIREWQDGLPQNSIQAVRQTSDGNLWVATFEGLTRFDGTRFVTFNRQNTPAFGVRGVFRLFEGTDGTLWVGTLGGGVVGLKDGKFTPYATAGTFVRGFDEDRDGVIWVATDRGLNFIANGAVQPPPDDARLKADIRAVVRAPDGSMWIATAAGALLQMAGRSSVRASYDIAAGVPPQMTVLAATRDGAIWIGAETGAFRFAGGKAAPLALPPAVTNTNVRGLYADREGAVWIGFDGGGLLRWYAGSVAHLGLADGLSSDIIRSFWEDREGTLWIGTNGGGLNALRRDKIVTFAKEAGLRSNDVRCVLQDRKGFLWIGTAGGGLSRMDGNAHIITYGTAEGLPGTYIRTLAESPDGKLWIGTIGGGLAAFDGKSFHAYSTRDGLPSRNVNTVLVTRAGIVWAQTDGGLVQFSNGRFVPAVGSDIYSKRTVKSIYEDRRGDIWIGFVGELLRWTNGHAERVSLGGDLNNQSIFTMFDDGQGNLWLGTDGGLVRFRPNDAAPKFTAYRMADGLFDETVFSIVEDGAHNLWMTSNRGLYRVAKADLDAFDAHRIRKIPSPGYGKADGMRTDQCNGNSTPSAWRASDGRIWFTTVRGVSVINPADIPLNTLAPPVYVEEVVADGATVPVSNDVHVPANTEKFEFHYTALSFMAPEKVLFRYKLENFDKEWVDAGTRRTAYYTNLPPGRYDFRVIASNNDGVWNRNGASIHLDLPTPLWKTWWARLSYLAIVASIILALMRMRVSALHARAAELEHRVHQRTAEIADNLVRLEISERRAHESEQRALEASQAKSAFLANMSHELRTPLNAIIGYSEILEEEAVESNSELVADLRKIRTAGRHLLELINSVLDLSKIEAGKMSLVLEDVDVCSLVDEVAVTARPLVEKNANTLESACSADAGTLRCDIMKVRQVLLNLLSNAGKFTERGRVRLDVTRSGDTLQFVVSDTGIGMNREQSAKIFQPFTQAHSQANRKYGGTGLGLALSQRFCQMMGGDITLESEPGMGSKFTVTLPSQVRKRPEVRQEAVRV